MCIESEGAERSWQHCFFLPQNKSSPQLCLPSEEGTGEHMASFIRSRFTLVFLSTVLGNRWRRNVAVFSHSPHITTWSTLNWLQDIFIPALGFTTFSVHFLYSIVVTQSPALEPIPEVKMTVQMMYCPGGTKQYSDNINSHITIVSFEGLWQSVMSPALLHKWQWIRLAGNMQMLLSFLDFLYDR